MKFTPYLLPLCLIGALVNSAQALSKDLKNETHDRPNIIFIAADDLTAKYVGAFGAKHIQTPNIDALAKKGVKFNNSVVQGTMCGPSRNSMLTGQYPHNLGFYINGTLKNVPVDGWNLPNTLQQNGYATSWIGKSHIRTPNVGLEKDTPYRGNVSLIQDIGFDEATSSHGRAVLSSSAKKMAKDPGMKWQYGHDMYADYIYKKGLFPTFVKDLGKISTLPVNDYLDGNIANRAVNWIEGYKREQPFFLWVNFSGPHGPYDAPGMVKYTPEQMPPVIIDKDHSDIPGLMRTQLFKGNESVALEKRTAYAGMITFLDQQVGRILQAIDDKGVRDNTLIVFYSDHGIMEGDHGLNHKYTFYKEVLNASLIIDLPGGQEGKAINRPVELLDVVQTALDVAEVPVKQRTAAKGYSLKPILDGSGDIARTAAYAEIYNGIAMVTENYKYIETAQGNVLFDVRNDPNERVNAIKSLPEVAKNMAAGMEKWRNTEAGEFKWLEQKTIDKIEGIVAVKSGKVKKVKNKDKKKNKNKKNKDKKNKDKAI
ncbi:sulfatase [Thalassotalea crassostreae]|uniref:sulfatase family protein n=1 Tax=Thalassotalea crassostreae TaxID=1763536 RepID=UPI000838465C|nr:sulfatase-like hydrolase/transferase [Thalassotalea crassostreae]